MNDESIESLKEQNKALSSTLTATLQFLVAEMSWEYFRAEMLYARDEEKKTASGKNAETLRRFLRDAGERHPAVAEALKEAERRQV